MLPQVRRLLRQGASRLAACIAIALPAAGCAPAQVLNALVPASGYWAESGIAYGPRSRQRLDVYVPDRMARPAPVVIFFYGGGWRAGDREDYRFVGQALAARGFITVIPDYRLWPEVQFPSFVEDGARAAAWAHDHTGAFGGDADRIHLMGHSAGAHIAALLALDRRFLATAGVDPQVIASLIGVAGPYDFLPLESERLQRIFAVDDLTQTQPITFIRPDAPPVLLLHGRDDETVGIGNSRRLATGLEAVGAQATLRTYDDFGHFGTVLALATPFRWLGPVLDDVTRFIRDDSPSS